MNNSMIGKETVLLRGEYNQDGQVCTRIKHGNMWRLEKVAPLKLIDESLKKFGSSLRGALDGSKFLLGNKNMRPIVFDPFSGIYLFPSKSPAKADCVWFNILHIIDYKPINRYQTKVFLNYGGSIILDMRECNFKRKLNRTFKLRRLVSENMKIPITFFIDPTYSAYKGKTQSYILSRSADTGSIKPDIKE
ncbi:competence transcription factor (CTF) [Neobacillus massiliamazoniensis]|uniref:Competence transcription factor (CTF) n=2 Tax=Neobacillus massiliamazoniensis TaxID=1499688 RepID=A0A0U1NSM6_9BACI|nr:competence transcription factor (CTF) [Neobacillus massiliamazoniensis]